ncbi:uncharacterized protein LOC132735293 [Ruditapes philippinarum]|uniref:uncharacterized protein LOC132735293 n=1 Tax=Ruditapes philippinarum TaxID=129788 RepID=UPI00295C0813|nr:uncharacterized protein LOC132735293 [Ruditapes philippinarum]
MNSLVIVSLFGIVLAQLLVVDGLKCYTCSTNCGADTDNLNKVDCNGGFCTKTADQNDTIINRGCSKTAKSAGCSNTNNLRICVCNDEDLCNGSRMQTATATSTIFLVIVAIMLTVM